MKPHEREMKIMDWFNAAPASGPARNADVLNYEFEEFVEKQLDGAKMSTAMSDLRSLYYQGRLRRFRATTGMPWAGAPAWVMSYLL